MTSQYQIALVFAKCAAGHLVIPTIWLWIIAGFLVMNSPRWDMSVFVLEICRWFNVVFIIAPTVLLSMKKGLNSATQY